MKTASKCLTILLITFLISACKKDADTPDIRDAFTGTYTLVDTSPAEDGSENKSEYDIIIHKSATDANTIEIANFAGLLKKNVRAVLNGETFTIPAQVFISNTNSQITITGSGVRKGTSVTYTYAVRGAFKWDSKCLATKK